MRNLVLIIFFLNVCQPVIAQLLADFQPSRFKICSGATISLTNLSSGANYFQWLIDGQFYSASIDTQATLIENCYDMKTITLVACDSASGICDTSNKFVEVFDSCFFHWTGDFVNCPGDTISLSTHSEAIATNWVISGPYTLLGGCDTCPSISFIIQQQGQSVDRQVTYLGNCSESTSFHYLCSISSVEEVENDFDLFPNPSHGQVTIRNNRSSEVRKLVVFDRLGRTILANDEPPAMINLQPGFYYFSFTFSDKSVITRKVIVVE